jgi:hypothetical protein
MSQDLTLRDSLLNKSKAGYSLARSAESESTEWEYNPDDIPPNFALAELHAKSKRIYHYPENFQPEKLCPCCGLPSEGGVPFPITEDLKSVYHLGCGYALYFLMEKHCIIVLGIMFAISGLPNIITSILESECSQDDTPGGVDYCYANFYTLWTIAEKRNHKGYMSLQAYLNFFTVVVLMLYFQYIRYTSRKVAVEADDQTITPSDFTVQIKGCATEPTRYPYTDEEIIDFVESHGESENPIKVVKVCRA